MGLCYSHAVSVVQPTGRWRLIYAAALLPISAGALVSNLSNTMLRAGAFHLNLIRKFSTL
jgi:hypothetical protein